MIQNPTIGRVVHYVLRNGPHRPAEVVNAFGNDRPNLLVKLDSTNDLKLDVVQDVYGLFPEASAPFVHPAISYQVDSVPHDEETKAPGTWHWPERV